MARRSAHSPGKALAEERKAWVRARARAELVRLRGLLAGARMRRKAALRRARQTCVAARSRVRDEVRAFRARELARVNREAARMRNQARAQCQARTHRIKESGKRAIERAADQYASERKLQRQLSAADRHVKQSTRNTARERAQESDDAVRSNLPGELLPVFERVRKHIKGSRHRTRTEAFLEWAQEHPEDVLSYQGDATDAEVRKLVAEYEAAAKHLRKTEAPRRRRRAAGDDDVPF